MSTEWFVFGSILTVAAVGLIVNGAVWLVRRLLRGRQGPRLSSGAVVDYLPVERAGGRTMIHQSIWVNPEEGGLLAGRPLPKHLKIVHGRRFVWNGMEVHETVIEWSPQMNKLIWCRMSLDTLSVEGRPNPLVHVNYPSHSFADIANLLAARERVAKEFDRYWSSQTQDEGQKEEASR